MLMNVFAQIILAQEAETVAEESGGISLLLPVTGQKSAWAG